MAFSQLFFVVVCVALAWAQPNTPTLAVTGSTPATDLSLGGTYTLTCTSTTAGSTYSYLKDGTAIASETLTAVTSASSGTYTCIASNGGQDSSPSTGLVVTVGAAGLRCTAGSDCTAGTDYTGDCTSNRCVCTSTYTAVGIACIEKPATPVLSITGATVSDLSAGADYTLSCVSTTAGSTYTFYKAGSALSSATLTTVSSSGTDGSYTCKATNNGADSDTSAAVTLAVGAAGLRCTANSGCTATGYSGTCTSNRCVCATNYWASGAVCALVGKVCATATASTDCSGTQYTGTCTSLRCVCASGYTAKEGTCSSAVTITVSVFAVLLAFVVSKLF